jgi:hypothetical protein
MVTLVSLKFLYSFLYSELINLIQIFGFLPLPYISHTQLRLSVTHVPKYCAFVLGLQSAYEGEDVSFGLLSLANFT